MKILIRMAAVTGVVSVYALRIAAGVVGLLSLGGPIWGPVLAVVLLWLRLGTLLQLAVVIGAVWVWHWPWVLALLLAAPRLLLLLPGLISTFLARRRHPRELWSPAENL